MSGSPPPVWGTLYKAYTDKLADGITPTCVGNTLLLNDVGFTVKDHPHLCGEHFGL